MSKVQTVGNTIVVRKNTGADVGTRPRLNVIEGANVTLTVSDDAGSNEVDITIAAAAGGGGSDWLNQFFPAVDTNAYKGSYATIAMLDAVDTDVWQTFMIPSSITALITAVVVVIPDASGNIRWQCTTNFGKNGEDYQTHVDAAGPIATAVSQNELEYLDITSALSAMSGGDIVGMKFTRTASNVLDTIGDTVHYIGVLIIGTT